jgi:hypothetical protein
VKKCPQCRTKMNADAPYCDACGCIFPSAAPAKAASDLKVFIGALAMFLVVIVLVAFFANG